MHQHFILCSWHVHGQVVPTVSAHSMLNFSLHCCSFHPSWLLDNAAFPPPLCDLTSPLAAASLWLALCHSTDPTASSHSSYLLSFRPSWQQSTTRLFAHSSPPAGWGGENTTKARESRQGQGGIAHQLWSQAKQTRLGEKETSLICHQSNQSRTMRKRTVS